MKMRGLKILEARQLVVATSMSLLLLLLPLHNAHAQAAVADDNFETLKHLDIFYSLYKELNQHYVDPLSAGDLIKKGIDAMLLSLDPYTVYIPESQTEDMKLITTGKYGGIGALIRQDKDYTVITQPYKDSPADKAGLLAGDVIVAIDGRSVKGLRSDEVSELLRGEQETTLQLSVKRPTDNKQYDFTLVRKEIKLATLPCAEMIDDKTGYVYLSSFTANAHAELAAAIRKLQQHSGMESLVLDLRDNPGGLLMEAVKICNLFVAKDNTILSTKGKIAEMNHTYTATDNPLDTTLRLVVLINRSSASASEIVAGTMQDLDRGVIVGQRSFGKGLVQTTCNLPYNSILKVTTAKYYIPSGRCIQALDYTHRNADGSVGHIPDSLISEFTTRNGRKVYDGGGINPDITIEPEMLSNVAADLVLKNFIFDYAVLYKSQHDSIAPAADFELSDSDYADFVAWVTAKDFDYETRTEVALKSLIEAAKKEKYYAAAESALTDLQSKMAHDRAKDLSTFADEIKELLAQEIIVKYYYDEGNLIYMMRHDPEIAKAAAILRNPTEYSSILRPQ